MGSTVGRASEASPDIPLILLPLPLPDLCSGRCPLPGLRDKGRLMGRPVMQHGGIEIRAIRPDKGRHFRVYADLLKDHQVLERAVQVSSENRAKINRLFGVIGKADTQRVRGQFS